MRVVVIGEPERRAAQAVIAHAGKPENAYVPGPKAKVPGNDPRHVLWLGELRCVFSITKVNDRTYRHLSTSVGNRTSFPNPALVEEAAHLLGFEGKVADWSCAADPEQGCVVVFQPLPQENAESASA